ncbi:hypothetical protein D3C76_1410170 [compost metagenome]
MSRLAVIGAGLQAAAIAAVLSFGNQLAVLPTRRREFEPDFDLNQLLDDPGKRAERDARKADRKARMRDAQRRAFTGGEA